jgi:restriction endonuclease S subunit
MPTEIGFGSTEFHVIRKRSDDIYMPFIWAIFSNNNVLKAAQASFGGSAGQQRVSADFIKNFPAVLPEYNTQITMVRQLENNLKMFKDKLHEADELLSGMDNLLLERLDISPISIKSRTAVAVKLGTLKMDNTFSANYYHSERLAIIHALEKDTAISTRKLADIVDFCRNIVSANNGKPYLGLAGIVSNTGELSGVEEEAEGQAFEYKTGDVLYARLRPYLNKVLYAETDGICSTEFHVMRVNCNDVLPEYLAAIMRSKIIVSQTKHMMTGNTHPRISNDDVKNLRLPVPSLDIQHTIVNEIRKSIEQVRRLKQEAESEWATAKEQFERELMGR